MRKVFLEDLPRWENGTNKGKINWEKSVGYNIKFIYDDLNGEINIIKYYIIISNKRRVSYLEIKYNDNTFHIRSINLSLCRLGTIIGKFVKQYRYHIDEIVETKTGKIQIIDQIKMQNKYHSTKGYKYKCLVDGNVDYISESNLHNGKGCNVCCTPATKVLKNYNDLWTTHPEIAELLKNPSIGFEISSGSNKTEIFICPNCGFEKSFIINNIVKQYFSCPLCSDGISYPNKFVRAFLEQVNEEYIPEYSPDWALVEFNNELNGKKRYDNFLPLRNEFWEVHGKQHYEENNYLSKSRSLMEEQKNDKLKKCLVLNNGYKYVEIDCKYSELEYIKNSIINLPETKRYDLFKVDWNKCHEFACNSLVKIACDYWDSGIKNTLVIAKKMKLNSVTIIKYLKQGTKLNWCNYNAKDVMRQNGKIYGGSPKRKIIQLTLDNLYIKEWDSISIAENVLNISNIRKVCKGYNKSAGGYRWMYKEDYDKYIKQIINYEDCLNRSFLLFKERR